MLMTKMGTVLVISDDPGIAQLIRRSIGGRGFEVTNAEASGKEFARMIEEMAPVLVIVDAQMPSLGGIALSLSIRQKSATPILMLTTWGAEEDRVRYLDLSADTYLTEPVTIYELAAEIDDILRRS